VAGKSRSPQRLRRVEAPREVRENEEKFKADKAKKALDAEKKRQRELKKKVQAEKNEKAMKRQSMLAEKSKHLLAGAGEKASKFDDDADQRSKELDKKMAALAAQKLELEKQAEEKARKKVEAAEAAKAASAVKSYKDDPNVRRRELKSSFRRGSITQAEMDAERRTITTMLETDRAYLTWRDGRTALLDCNTHLPIEDVNPEDYGFYATSPAISDSPPAELPHRAHTMAKSHEVEDRVEAFLASLRD